MKRVLSLIALLTVPAYVGAAEKITYDDHVRAIFNSNCVTCHNPDKNKAGLNLTTYQGAMAGSSNGKILQPGTPDDSLIYQLVTHQEEPHMPPKSGKLPDAQLDIIRKWIEGGALESSGSSVAVVAKPKIEMKLAAAAIGKPQGPPPMPKDLPLDPIVRPDRAAAPGALAASPWAPLIALAAPHQVLLYHAQTRELLGVLPFAAGLPKVLTFSRNGSVLLAAGGVAGQSGKVVLYDVITGRQIAEVGEEYDEVLAADISPDQSTIALGGPAKLLKIYSTSGGPPLHKLTQHTDWITAVAYSPDGVLLASGDRNGGLRVWEAASGNEFYTLNGHKAAITRVCFRADSNVLASCSEDGAVKLWDMNSGTEMKSWPGHPSGTLAVDFAPDGRLVTTGRDQVVRLWAPDGKKLLDLPPLRDIAIHAIFALQGALVVADDVTGQVKVTSATDGKAAGDLDTNPAPIAERIVEARKHLADAEAAAAKAAADLTAPQAAADKANAELQTAQAAAATAQKALTDAQSKATAAAAAIQPASAALDAANKVLLAKQAEHDRLAQATTAPATLPSNSADAALRSAKQDVDAKRAANEKLSAELTAANAAVQKAQSDLTAATAAVQPRADQAKTAAEALAKVKAISDAAVAQVAAAKADLTKWKRAQVSSELAAAKQELADISARQQKLTQALQQLEAASQLIREGPQKLQQAEQRLAKAKEAAALAHKAHEESQARLTERESLVKQNTELLKNLQAASTKDPQNKPLAEATQKAKQSLDIITAELAATRTTATTTATATKTADAELTTATSTLTSIRAELADAPKRVEESKGAITSSDGDQSARIKSLVERLSAENERLQKQP